MRVLQQTEKSIDIAKTIAEHEAIILNYLRTGQLNRKYAINKYTEFNLKHHEFCDGIGLCKLAGANVMPLERMPNGDIVNNLNAQLVYIGGKNLLEGLNNG